MNFNKSKISNKNNIAKTQINEQGGVSFIFHNTKQQSSSKRDEKKVI
jgi:hypothetical protein